MPFKKILLIIFIIALSWQFIAYPLNQYLYCSTPVKQKQYLVKNSPSYVFEIDQPEKIEQYADYDEMPNSSLHLTQPIRWPGENVTCKTDKITLKLKNTNIIFPYQATTQTTEKEIDRIVNNILDTNRIFKYGGIGSDALIIRNNDAESQENIFLIDNKMPVKGFKSYVFIDPKLGLGRLNMQNNQNVDKLANFIKAEKVNIDNNNLVLSFYSLDGGIAKLKLIGSNISKPLIIKLDLKKVGDDFTIENVTKTN